MVTRGLDEPIWIQQPIFSTMHCTSSVENALLATGDGIQGLRHRFANAPSQAEAAVIVAEGLIGKLRRNLSKIPDDVNFRTSIHTCGVDSLLAIELRTWLAKYLDADVPIFGILSGTSFASLGVAVAGKAWKGRERGRHEKHPKTSPL